MANKIFINYRRDDDPGFALALYQRLEGAFTADDLFFDVEGKIKPGDDFVEVLNAQVAAADVLLAVIGPRWIESLAARASVPDDFVIIEIQAAIEKKTRVIPVLVGGARMPTAEALPEAIRRLARLNAVTLRIDRFAADCRGLVQALEDIFAEAETGREEAERYEADAARALQATESSRHPESERNWRPETGSIAGLTDKGFGFIKVVGLEKDIFFHLNELMNVAFEELRQGDEMSFEMADGPKGPIAVRVRRI